MINFPLKPQARKEDCLHCARPSLGRPVSGTGHLVTSPDRVGGYRKRRTGKPTSPQVLRALKKPSSPCPCPKTLQICYPRGRGRKPMSSSDIWMPLTSGFREPARAKPIIAPSGTAEPSLDFGACVSGPWPYEAQWVVPVRGLQKHALQVYGLSL